MNNVKVSFSEVTSMIENPFFSVGFVASSIPIRRPGVVQSCFRPIRPDSLLPRRP